MPATGTPNHDCCLHRSWSAHWHWALSPSRTRNLKNRARPGSPRRRPGRRGGSWQPNLNLIRRRGRYPSQDTCRASTCCCCSRGLARAVWVLAQDSTGGRGLDSDRGAEIGRRRSASAGRSRLAPCQGPRGDGRNDSASRRCRGPGRRRGGPTVRMSLEPSDWDGPAAEGPQAVVATMTAFKFRVRPSP